MRRKSRSMVCRAISESAPASSTPVGPAPTMTKVSHARCRSGSVSRSAASNASSTRRRISSASSIVFRPGAFALPLGMAEVRMRRAGGDDEVVVRELAVGQRDDALAIGVDAPSRRRGCTLTFFCCRRIARIGAAMSLGFSAAVATW